MKYDIALKLKEVGFPQTIPTHCLDRYSADGSAVHMWEHHTGDPLKEFNDPNAVRIPTLEELIASCGEEFGGLILRNGKFGAGSKDQPIKDEDFIYDTPSEAVANLWLALNK